SSYTCKVIHNKLEGHAKKDILSSVDYSRVKLAADARHRVCSCGPSPRMGCNEADAVRSARL
ncbi:MAG: hypothetical protein U9Q97_09610, partial [Acidobacteriota bacterium]|nr:hypothetical protein [Acidobacteriota bacterium]